MCGALGLAIACAVHAANPRVMVIASAHAGHRWGDAELTGLREQLKTFNEPVTVDVDFLDTLHVLPSPRYYQAMEALLLTKYGPRPPDVLVAVGDEALDFALPLRRTHFQHTPLIFSGVSSSRRDALARESNAGGVFDDLDLNDNLHALLRLLPQTQRVVVVHDVSRTSLAQVATLQKAAASFAPRRIDYLSNHTLAELRVEVGQLGRHDLVLELPMHRDREGHVFSQADVTDILVSASPAPLVITRDTAMRPGVLGGFLVSGFEQGTGAGRLALAVLQGHTPSPLPFLSSESHGTFDFAQMQRWAIPIGALPVDVTVLQAPESAMEMARHNLPWIGALLLSLLLIVALWMQGIRHRQRSAQALQIEEQKYRELFNHSPDAIVVRDMNSGRIVETNPRFQAMFGYSAEESKELGIHDTSAPGQEYDIDKVQAWFDRVDQQGAQVIEWRNRRKDGSLFWSEVSMTRVRLGPIQRTISTVRDISDRKQAEALAKASELRVRQVYENLPIAMFAIDAQHRVTLWNPQMERLSGVAADKVVGTTDCWVGTSPEPRPYLANLLVDGTPYEVLQRHYPQLSRSASVPGAMEGEEQLSCVGRDGLWVRFCAAPLYDTQGQRTGAIETLIDVSQLKKAQTTLEALNHELEARVEARNQELQRAMGQLVQSEKLAALGSLVAGIAHELNTPIGNVLAVASTLTEEVERFSQRLLSGQARRSEVETGAGRMREASTLIERNASKAAKLIRDFKGVAVDQSSTRRRQFMLRHVLAEVLSTTSPLFKNSNHHVALDVPESIVLDSYPGPLEQVMTNFLTNSLHHGFEGIAQGQISIHAHIQDEAVQLTYSDNGCGIADANLQHVFEPFYTTKLGRGGSGLGLYIVYNLVHNVLGGSISVHSTRGTGTRFVLQLPLHAPASPNPLPTE